MTEREEAFIAQGKIIQEILDFKQELITEKDRTIGKCFNHTAICGVTSDPTFEKEMLEKEPDSVLLEKIDLCDRLVEFCRTNTLSKENADMTRFLFNYGKFRKYNELDFILSKSRKNLYHFIIPAIIFAILFFVLIIKEYWLFLLVAFLFVPSSFIATVGIVYILKKSRDVVKYVDTTYNVQKNNNNDTFLKKILDNHLYIMDVRTDPVAVKIKEPKFITRLNEKIEKMFE